MTGTIPSPGEERTEPDEHRENVVERVFGNRYVLLGLLLALLAWVAVARIWLFVLIMAIVASVFLHEMGHFLMAKRNGMKVTEFFLGFGPRVWSFRRGETEYGIKLVPAGAYVRIIGMHNLEDLATTDDEGRTYRSQSYWRRMPVVLAGPVMNLVLGFLLLVVVFAGFGHPSADTWRISTVSDSSAAQAAGLEPGDRILSIDGQSVGGFDDFTPIVRTLSGRSVDLEVERDGQRTIVPVTVGWALDTDGARAFDSLVPGDRVVAVGTTPIESYDQLRAALADRSGPTEVTFDRNGRVFTTVVTTPLTLPAQGSRGFLGVSPESVLVRSGVVTATGEAAGAFGETITGSVAAMGRIFSPEGIGRLASQVANGGATDTNVTPVDTGSSTGNASSGGGSRPANADRPMSLLGIVNIGAELGEETGWAGVLALLATVNIFLGLINLVPLLPFDGGHIAVATYEEIRSRVRGRPYRVDMAKLMPVTYVVVLLMVGLFMSTLYLDAVDPVRLTP
ncbi:MAG: PDZ domain-containing protein [Acidimicrobiia bacterium]|nr:PDZ domain-containing protein [Acidimicrobiia bacterium]